MKIIPTKLMNLKIIKGVKYSDNRGFFRELYKKKLFPKTVYPFWFISKSKKNVLRGMHLQSKNAQEKIVSVMKGKILDVVIDLRKKSKTFGKHFKIILSDKNCTSILIPKGFAHGFLGLEKENILLYGSSDYRSNKNEIGIRWNDKELLINWPKKKLIISKKDKNNLSFNEFRKLKLNL